METPVPFLIDVGDTHLGSHIFKRAVAKVAVKRVLAADGAVGDVDVGEAIAVEINNGYACAHRSDFRHDAFELGIKRRGLMNEVDAGRP